jgi:hypothetical protein
VAVRNIELFDAYAAHIFGMLHDSRGGSIDIKAMRARATRYYASNATK